MQFLILLLLSVVSAAPLTKRDNIISSNVNVNNGTQLNAITDSSSNYGYEAASQETAKPASADFAVAGNVNSGSGFQTNTGLTQQNSGQNQSVVGVLTNVNATVNQTNYDYSNHTTNNTSTTNVYDNAVTNYITNPTVVKEITIQKIIAGSSNPQEASQRVSAYLQKQGPANRKKLLKKVKCLIDAVLELATQDQ